MRIGKIFHQRPVVAAATLAVVQLLLTGAAPLKEQNAAEPYIVDADASALGEFPYYARSTVPTQGLCGGALVWPDVIVTAAHCHEGGALSLGIDVGYYNSTDTAFTRQPVTFRRHPGYNHNNKLISHDIMVIQLDEPVWEVPPVQLNADPAVPADFDPLIVCGTGRVVNGGTTTDVLTKATLYVVPSDVCRDTVGDDNIVIRDDILCAGLGVDLESPCQGDSGGPLVRQLFVHHPTTPGPHHELVGLVSFGQNCGITSPAGFARISTFYKWIWQQICELSQYPPLSDCPPPLAAPDPTNAMKITLTISYGTKPADTTFSIRDASTMQIVYTGPEYNPTIPYGLYDSEFYLTPGEYWLELYDLGQDGLKGFVQDGYYEMTGENNNKQQQITLVERQEEIWGKYARHVFVVPDVSEPSNVATPFPTTSPNE